MYYAINSIEKIYLSEDTQMDRYLADGYSIYEENIDGEDILVATPDKGYLIPKPVFPIEEGWTPWKNQ